MAASTTMTLRLRPGLKSRLEKLAKVCRRTKSYIAGEAISEYVRINEFHIQEIKRGMAEAKRGELIDHADILKEWEKKLAHSLDSKS